MSIATIGPSLVAAVKSPWAGVVALAFVLGADRATVQAQLNAKADQVSVERALQPVLDSLGKLSERQREVIVNERLIICRLTPETLGCPPQPSRR